jgi:hypothetical protein
MCFSIAEGYKQVEKYMEQLAAPLPVLYTKRYIKTTIHQLSDAGTVKTYFHMHKICLVGVIRLERTTSRPPAVRATNCATPRYVKAQNDAVGA